MAPTTRSTTTPDDTPGPSQGSLPSHAVGVSPNALVPHVVMQHIASAAPPQSTSEIVITERFLTDPRWPNGLILELNKSNWGEWSLRLELLASRTGFAKWLNGSLTRPDENTHPRASWIWESNDESLRAFTLERISRVDLHLVRRYKTSHEVFQALRGRHERLGLYAQVLLLKRALNIRFDINTPLSTTVSEICQLHERFCNMGPIDQDNMFSILLINALGDQFSHLQSSLQTMTDDPNFSSDTLLRRLDTEEV